MMCAATLEPKEAHLRQAKRALPGPVYLAVLVWIHRVLRPATYVEIGVGDGESLRTAQPDTLCVGIDPAPRIDKPLAAPTCLFTMTSDEFFARHDLSEILAGQPLALAFIDGLHLFEQALRDFIHLERRATARSIVLLHDCLPLDENTSARTRTTEFYSGDVWKAAACLRELRPDLRMTIVPTPPTGLCIISGLDPTASVLERAYDRAVDRYMDLTFDDYRDGRVTLPRAIPNTKAAVSSYVSEEIRS
jgi:hypothetical protein